MFLKIKDVWRILKTSINTIYALQKKDPNFPKPIKFGDQKQGRVFYRESEIKDWVLSLNPSDSELEDGKWMQKSF